MKIYFINSAFNSGDGETEYKVTAYASRELAEQAIKKMIKDEINTQIDNGKIERNEKGKIIFVNGDGTETVEISATRLSLANSWGWYSDLWITEEELITAQLRHTATKHGRTAKHSQNKNSPYKGK